MRTAVEAPPPSRGAVKREVENGAELEEVLGVTQGRPGCLRQ